MDDVKRLLEQFADRAVDGLPPADVDADVTRGRRALRRIKARRRVTGVLCVAAATTAVLVVGDQSKWWGGGGEAEVATDAATTQTQPQPDAATAGSATPSGAEEETFSTYSATVVQLVSNAKPWNAIGCTLTPLGWTAAPQSAARRVVLTPPSARTADTSAQLELFTAAEPQPLSGIRAVETGGKVFHVGSTGGREVGQVQLGETWLVAKLPIEHQDWNDDLVRRFLASCTVS
ncbi:hypothetical protein [Kribbella italica]|uniref:Uncharacterized protein n=1 Tax=Kribbella italica TaxID=1540520 RepID=A0A7W9MU58_9ACTN|nr:hypothetical protein [Kribbella italica]MBB5836414.1 hypothetical protein [Kribbella italica]